MFFLILRGMAAKETATLGVASKLRANFGLRGSSGVSSHSESGGRGFSSRLCANILEIVDFFGCLKARWRQCSSM